MNYYEPTLKGIGDPVGLSKSKFDAIIEAFVAKGSSVHSGTAGTLWVVVRYCESNRIPYQITAVPDYGYQINIIEPLWIKIKRGFLHGI